MTQKVIQRGKMEKRPSADISASHIQHLYNYYSMNLLHKVFALLLVLACLLTGVISAKAAPKKAAPKKPEAKKGKGKGKPADDDEDEDDEDEDDEDEDDEEEKPAKGKGGKKAPAKPAAKPTKGKK